MWHQTEGGKKSQFHHGLLKSIEVFVVRSSGVELNSRIQSMLRTLFYGTLLET